MKLFLTKPLQATMAKTAPKTRRRIPAKVESKKNIWQKEPTKDGDEAEALGKVNVGPKGKGSDDEDGDASDAGGDEDRLDGVGDADDADEDAVEAGNHSDQDDVEWIPPAHLSIT